MVENKWSWFRISHRIEWEYIYIYIYIYIRRPRPSPRPGRRLGPPQVWNLSCRTTARAELDKTFRGRAIQTVQTIKPFQTLQTFTLKQLPQQAPQGQGHSNDFLWAFKAAVCQPANAPNPSKIPNTFPNRHPRAKATSPTGTPGPRPQQWLSIGFQSCRLPARKRSKRSKTLQTLQTPSKTLQTLQTLENLPNPPNTPKPSKPSKHLPQQAPQGQGHFSNRHPRAKATAMAFYWLSKLPFASPQTLQTLQNPPNPPKPSKPSKHPPKPSKPSKPSKTFQTLQTPSKTLQTLPKPSKPSKHPPQQAPQGQGHLPNRHPRAKAAA